MIYNNVLEAVGQTPLIRLNRMVDADSAEVLLQTIEKLRQARYLSAKSAVYTLNGRYYLIFDSILPDAYRRVLSEYTRKTGGAITAARVREYGTPVCEQHAVSAIGKWL